MPKTSEYHCTKCDCDFTDQEFLNNHDCKLYCKFNENRGKKSNKKAISFLINLVEYGAIMTIALIVASKLEFDSIEQLVLSACVGTLAGLMFGRR